MFFFVCFFQLLAIVFRTAIAAKDDSGNFVGIFWRTWTMVNLKLLLSAAVLSLLLCTDVYVLVADSWCAKMTGVNCALTIRVYGASFFSLFSSVDAEVVDCPGCAGASVSAADGPVGDVSTKTSSVTRKRISSPWSMYKSCAPSSVSYSQTQTCSASSLQLWLRTASLLSS